MRLAACGDLSANCDYLATLDNSGLIPDERVPTGAPRLGLLVQCNQFNRLRRCEPLLEILVQPKLLVDLGTTNASKEALDAKLDLFLHRNPLRYAEALFVLCSKDTPSAFS